MLGRPVPSKLRWLVGGAVVVGLTLATGIAAWASQPRSLAVESAPVPTGKIKAQLSLRVDGGQPRTFTMINAIGMPFSANVESGGHAWNIELTAKPLPSNTVEYYLTLRRDGKEVAAPRGLAKAGEPAMIVGAQVGNGSIKGVELAIAFYMASGKSGENVSGQQFPLRAGLLRYAAKVGVTIDNPEMLGEPAGAHKFFFDERIPADDLLQKLAHENGLDVEIEGKHARFVPMQSPPGRVSTSADSSATRLSVPPPKYPNVAAENGISGKVTLIVDVAADGSVAAAKVERADPAGVFDASALETVKKWRFTPATKDGKPVASRVRVPIEWRADGEAG